MHLLATKPFIVITYSNRLKEAILMSGHNKNAGAEIKVYYLKYGLYQEPGQTCPNANINWNILLH